MAVLSDFFKNTYRTHVLNDFSIVTKAVFYGLELNGKKYTLKDRLPVQINPDNLDQIRSSKVICSKGVTDEISGSKKGDEDDTLRVELHYNIYDEYNVRTNYGMTGAVDNTVSLMNEDFTSLPKLQSYAKEQNMYVLFRWGDVNFFGQIENVSCTYDVFSQWGNPLACRATVSVKACNIEGNTKNDISLACFNETNGVGIRDAIEGVEKIKKGLHSVALLGMDLSSEVSSLVLGGIQGALR